VSLLLRPAALDRDAEPMIKLLAATVNPRYDRARLEWLYLHNPDGPAAAWVMVDPVTEEIAGTAAAVPRRMRVGDRIELAWILSDFCVAERYRTLGPALQLQRACLAPVASGEPGFCYDFPSAGMLAVYRRLGVSPSLDLRRYALPLRVDRRLAKLGLPGVVAAPTAAAGNAVLGRRFRRRSTGDLEIFVEADFGPEFSDLDTRLGGEHAACVRRSVEYLDWRFLANPFQRHLIFTARRRRELVAYAIITSDVESPAIVDLFGSADGVDIRVLLARSLSLLRERGAVQVGMTLGERHPWVAILTSLGFQGRERQPLVVYGPKRAATTMAALGSPGWLVTSGDWDI
jgi:hypothetical protein